jgi:hypothetical protein
MHFLISSKFNWLTLDFLFKSKSIILPAILVTRMFVQFSQTDFEH